MLFSDLVGFTSFSERAAPAEVAALLGAYWGIAAPLLTRRFGGEVEKFIGDGVVEARAGLRVKGRDDAVDAYVLHALPSPA